MEEKQELRCESRIQKQYNVRMRVRDVPDPHQADYGVIQGITSDVSINGVRVAFLTNRPVPVGATVRLRIVLGLFRRSFRHEGVVRWVRRDPSSPASVLGVEFTDTSMQRMRRWEEYVRAVARSNGAELVRDEELSEAAQKELSHDAEPGTDETVGR